MLTIERRTTPDIDRLIKIAFPANRKQRAWVSVFSRVQVNSYWDGGSRSEYVLVEIASGRRLGLPTATHPYFDVAHTMGCNQDGGVVETDRVGNLTLKVLPEGVALVEAGTFCGKPATPHVYLNAANMPKRLEGGN